MKVAVFHNQPSGGARRALHGFCRELEQRHSVSVFTLSTSDRALLDEPATVFDYAPRKPIRFGLYLNDLRRRLDLGDLERVHATVAAAIDAGGFDVVLADVCRFTGAPFVLRYLRTPAAYYCHEPPRALHESAWRPHATAYERLRRLWRAPLEGQYARRVAREDRALVRSARAVLTNSEYTRERIKRVYGVHSAVCSPGIDLPPASADAGSPDRRGVLSVGALEPHKSFDFLIDAVSRLPLERRPPLVIVCNDQNPGYRRSLERRARTSGVDLTVKLRITDDQLAEEYATAALFAFAAHDEPLGLAPLEAMAHGLPVLAIGEGGVRETVLDGKTGVLVGRDTSAFARELGSLLFAPERLRELGEHARRHATEHWSWGDRAAVLESHLEALASPDGAVERETPRTESQGTSLPR